MNKNHSSAYFYGWNNTGIAFIANFMATGSAFYIFNAFMEPLVQQRGWTYTEVNRSLVLGPASAIVAQLFYGSMVYKVGPRILMTISPVIAGAFFMMLGKVQNIWQFYLCYILLCIGNGGMSGIVSSTVVNNWFEKKRGKALGFATAGISLSGVVIPIVALYLLQRTDLEHAYQWIGGLILLVSPLAWMVVRDLPEKHGLLPDGEPYPPQGSMESPQMEPKKPPMVNHGFDSHNVPHWTFKLLLKTGAFWKLGITYAMVLAGVAGVMSQLKPRFSHMGFDEWVAMAMMAATALMGTFGKFFWGMLCDHFDPRRVIAALISCGGLGLSIMFAGNSLTVMIFFIVIYGFAMGGVMATLPIIIADLFGRTAFAAVAKFMPFFIVLQGLGAEAMGRSKDVTGSYNTAYILFIVLDTVALFLILSIRRPVFPRQHQILPVDSVDRHATAMGRL